MILSTDHLIFYTANLLIIITSLITAVLYFCNIHQLTPEEDDHYFPARKMIGIANMLQLLQLPYLFNINSETVFFYVLTVDLLIYIPFSSIIWEKYLYSKNPTRRSVLSRFALPVSLILAFLIDLALGSSFFVNNRTLTMYGTIGIVLMEMIQFSKIVKRGYGQEIQLFQQNYSNERLFPKTFALRSALTMSARLSIILLSYFLANQWFKMGKDILFTLIAIFVLTFLIKKVRQNGFAQDFLRPQRSEPESQSYSESQSQLLLLMPDEVHNQIHNQIPDEIHNEEDSIALLIQEIKSVIEEHKLYQNPELKLADLLQYINSNRTYLSLAINRGSNMNFYQLIQSYRLDYSKELLLNAPEKRISEISDEAGFSSPKIFSRVFKQEMNMTPSEYRKNNLILTEKAQNKGVLA